MAFRQTTVEIGLNDRGQRAHAAKKNNEKKTKKLHSAKLNAPQPNLLQMIRRRAMCQRWSRFAGQFGGLAKVDSGFDYAANFSSFACLA